MRIEQVLYKTRIDSTSEALKRKADSVQSGTLLWADEQTDGRGMHGKVWHASPGENLTFSFLIRHPISIQANIQAATALAIKDVLQQASIDAVFKLPNDVYAHTQKIAGILVETKTDRTRKRTVIGVGLNVNEIFAASMPLAVSMGMLQNRHFDRKPLLEQFIDAYNRYVGDDPFVRFKTWVLSVPVYAHYQGDIVRVVDFSEDFTYEVVSNGARINVEGGHLSFSDTSP